MKQRTYLTILICLILIISLITGCTDNHGLDPDNPVTLTLWHNYGGQMKDTMDQLVDEFNNTVGTEKGIIINVTSISSSSALQEKLLTAANGDPAAPQLPDITTCYPQTALALSQKDLLVDLSTKFSDKELEDYVTDFINEGKINDTLYLFPIAKSTEVLFVNQTLFDRFSKATGVTIDSLNTFEGIAKASQIYYEWSGGKTFFMPDSWFNVAQVGMEQLGDSLIVNEKLNIGSDTFKTIWTDLFSPAASGAIAVSDSYSSELSKTGDIVCSTGSTAGILFYGDTITYSDNHTEEVEYTVLPYPTFETGEKIAIQRGGGMCVTHSNSEKEYAAGIFLKWFTSPEQNIKFVSSTGYLPVTNEAFGNVMENEIKNIENKNIKKLLNTVIMMQNEYDFYIPPNFEEFDSIQKDYESDLKELILQSRETYLNLIETSDSNTALKQVTENGFSSFIADK